jgi:hypothetical protein
LVPGERQHDVHTQVRTALDRLREPDGSIVMIQAVRYTVANRGS